MIRHGPSSLKVASTPLEQLPTDCVALAGVLVYGRRERLEAWLLAEAQPALGRQGVEAHEVLAAVDRANREGSPSSPAARSEGAAEAPERGSKAVAVKGGDAAAGGVAATADGAGTDCS